MVSAILGVYSKYSCGFLSVKLQKNVYIIRNWGKIRISSFVNLKFVGGDTSSIIRGNGLGAGGGGGTLFFVFGKYWY